MAQLCGIELAQLLCCYSLIYFANLMVHLLD